MDTNVNQVMARNIYGSAAGPTLGNLHSPMTPFEVSPVSQAGNTDTNGATQSVDKSVSSARGFMGQPLSWFIVLVVMLIGLKFVAGKLGGDEEFKSIRVSVHNVIIISLAAVIGIGFFKVVFNRWPVPGLTTYINAV
jgi:hypothetical protein